MKKPKVIVCQHGSRRRYAVAKILEEAGMLEALYTDSSFVSLLGRIAYPFKPLAQGQLYRLLERKMDGIPKDKIFSSDKPFLSDIWAYFVSPDEDLINRYLRRHQVLSRKMIYWGLQGANAVYSQGYEDQDFIKYAKDKGLKVIVDINTNPQCNRILLREYYKYKEFNLNKLDNSVIEHTEMLFRNSIFLADMILCPSEWVSDGVRDLCPEHSHKIRISPYGSSIDYNGQKNKPIKGRIFWAGRSWIGKGLHYLAMAADELKKKYPEMQFRAAGITDPKVTQMKRFKNITFLGKLNTKQMQNDYLSADIFVFPTLSEGMSGVALEAIIAGCPVITTRAAGIDAIENGKNGIIVSEGNAEELTAAIERVYSDRELRNNLATNTETLASEYTIDAQKPRLINILREL